MKLHEIKDVNEERSVLSAFGRWPEKVDKFDCAYRHLTSLEGGPKETVFGFHCSNNKLTSLNGGPEKVGGNFWCHDNKLTSLKGGPTVVGGDYWCHGNELTSLEGVPEEIGGSFSCSLNFKLTSLEGGPKRLKGNYWANNCGLTSLIGAPQIIPGGFLCVNNKLTSLKGIHLLIKKIDLTADFSRNPIKSHVLGLLKIKSLKNIVFDDDAKLQGIINKYLPEGNIFECQEELIDEGYEEYAQL